MQKTHDYLQKFCKITDKDKLKELKEITKENGIDIKIAIKIQDFGLTEYEHAVGLFPELTKYDKIKVLELLDVVKDFD